MLHTRSRPHHRRIAPVEAAPVASDNETLIHEYLEWKNTYAPRAANTYRVWVRRFQEFTNKAPEDLTIGDWTAFAGTLKGRFAPKSVEYALNIIHNYLRFWQEQGRLRQLPLYLARVPKAMACSHAAIREDEYRRMIAVLRSRGDAAVRDLTIVMLLHDTGMRVGELAVLEFEQIEEDASCVIKTEKTQRRRRVFWNVDTDEILHQLIVERVNQSDGSDWIFVSRQGREGDKPLTTRSVQRMIEATARAAGIARHLTPHSFRHAYIHRLAALGAPDAIIAQLVGHTTPHTISHYTKLSRVEFEQAARQQFRQPPVAA